jgi:hypothetical protein
LRNLPITTALPSPPLALAPDGSPVFRAYCADATPQPGLLTRFMPMSVPARRRGQQLVLATAALALVTVGAAGSSAASSATRPSVAQPADQVAPALLTSTTHR